MNVNYDFVVDFARPSKANTLIVSENDDRSRTLHFMLLANNQPLDMSDVKTAIISASLPDKTMVSGDVDIITTKDSSGNDVPINELNYTITRDLTNLAGRVTAKITLGAADGKKISSFDFYIEVRNKLYSEDDYVVDETKNNLMDLILRANTIIKEVEDKWTQITEGGMKDGMYTAFPLVIEYDEGAQNFTGADTRTVDLKKVARWAENANAEEIIIDESFVGNIKDLRDEIIDFRDQCSEFADAASTADAAAVTAQLEAKKAIDAADRAEKFNPTEVEVEALMESGRDIATITVNGETTTIYAPYGGGGEGGTSYYDELQNLPSINGVTLVGNKSTTDLGIEMPDLTGYATTDWVAGYAQGKLTPGAHVSIDRDGKLDIERTSVSVNQVQQPGTNSSKIATITINGEATDIYAPKSSGGGGEVVVNDNYNDLNNRPTFESKVLEGNLTKSFFGIPTKTSDITNDSHVSIDRSADSTGNTTPLADGGKFTASVATHDSYGHVIGYSSTEYTLPSYAELLGSKANQTALNSVGERVTALEGTTLTYTLAAGSTRAVLNSSSIKSSSMIDIYTDKYGLNPTSVTTSTGSITLEFEAQSSNVQIKVIVK